MNRRDHHLASLWGEPRPDEAHALALQHAPLLRMDRREPFLPLAFGYTHFQIAAASPSFPRQLRLPEGAHSALEYAIWWDWDIEHLYELEHVWVYLSAGGQVVAAEASWHGEWNALLAPDGGPPLQDGRVVVYSEPGKHAFAASPGPLLQRKQRSALSCGPRAGTGGVHVTPLYAGRIHERTPLNNQLVWTWLERRRFTPTWDFSRIVDLRDLQAVPWDALDAWIPGRVQFLLAKLDADIAPAERRVLRIAHRGASARAQENSLSAFRLAAELGADMVEVDLRLTADNVPVAAHDAGLQRVYQVPGNIADNTLAELRRMIPAGREPLLTLEQVIAACRDLQLGLYIDVKDVNEEAAATVLALLQRYGMLHAAVFGSFRADQVAEIKALCPAALTSILFSSQHVDPVLLARSLRADFVHPCWEHFARPQDLLTPQWLSAVREAGLGVMIWHEERPQVIHDLYRLGIYGICTDEPQLLLAAANAATGA